MKKPAAALPPCKGKPVAKDGAVGAKSSAKQLGAAKGAAKDAVGAKFAGKKRGAAEVAAKGAANSPLRQEKVSKKPVSWQNWAANDVMDDVKAEQGDVDGKDTSTLTKQQRHVFDKAANSGALPTEVAETWSCLKTSIAPGIAKERAAFVNALVPKDVGYGSLIDFNADAEIKKIRKLFRTKKGITEEHLEDRTAIECRLGGGDMARGARNLEVGLQRGHNIEVRNGVFKTVLNKAIDEVSDKVGMEAAQAGHVSDMKK